MATRLPCRYDTEAGNQQLRPSHCSQPSIFCYFSLVLERVEGIARELDSSITRKNSIPTPVCFTVSSFARFFLLRSTLYALHYTLYALHSMPCALHSTLYALHSTPCALRCTLYTLRSTFYALLSTLYALLSKLYTLRCTLYTLCSALLCFLRSLRCKSFYLGHGLTCDDLMAHSVRDQICTPGDAIFPFVWERIFLLLLLWV